MAKGGEQGCRAHLGTPGHDFSLQPLFRYSFLMIERQIEILAGVEEKQRGWNGGPSRAETPLIQRSRLPVIHPASQIKA